MNRRTVIWTTCFLLIAVLFWFSFNKSERAGGNSANQKAVTRSPEIKSSQSAKTAHVSGSTAQSTIPGNANPTTPSQDVTPEERRARDLQLSVMSKNVEINFWGRVVDQDGRPLSGVRVVMSRREWHYAPPLDMSARFPKTEIVTDGTGRFQLQRYRGDVLTLETLDKDGYEAEPRARRSFGYNTSENIVPDPNNPIVFRMWKAETKQALVVGDKFFPVIPDGRVYTVDLLKSTITEGETDGDLRVWIKRSSNAAWGKKYTWSFELTPINGGIAEESDRDSSMFLAPETGYVPGYKQTFDQSDQGWSYGMGRRLYIMSRGGRLYGRIDADIEAFYLKDNQGRLGLKYAVNPSGSRILR